MKYYKVIKEQPLFEVGAILSNEKDEQNYFAINEVYVKAKVKNPLSWGDGAEIVENSPEWYQQVYKVDLLTKSFYAIKEKALEALNKQFK